MPLYLSLLFVTFAFAANSVVTRFALETTEIDAVSFSLIRLLAGAMTFMLIFMLRRQLIQSIKKSLGRPLLCAAALFVYALCFSLAYLQLASGMGALLLFGSVQLTLMSFSYLAGERFGKLEFTGLILAAMSMVILCWPQQNESLAADWQSIILMTTAGSAWALFTFLGRTCKDPLTETGLSFMLCGLLSLPLLILFSDSLTLLGGLYAILSGAIFSALAYAAWYLILPRLGGAEIISSQLSVPALAAFGGWLWLSEPIDSQFLFALLILIIGIIMVFKGKTKK
ncbi:DMT family transporter [Gayadomonas joobiniege]|uniref:DMT family transporter n=1 Tax=Gayadomonas joobiniege TaxID=1234606 RepID=UPI000368F4E8|nr:DMT family transporter [Gayadomonas joobiniege]